MSNLTGFDRVSPRAPGLAEFRPDVHRLIADDLRKVEALFRDSLGSPLRIVDEIGSFIADGGGKRVRPTLHLLCSRLCGYRGPHAVLLR